MIHSFVRVHNCDCFVENAYECYALSYAIIRQCGLSSILPQQNFSYIIEVVVECSNIFEQAVAIYVEYLISVCFFLTVEDTGKNYIVRPANMTEME